MDPISGYKLFVMRLLLNISADDNSKKTFLVVCPFRIKVEWNHFSNFGRGQYREPGVSWYI